MRDPLYLVEEACFESTCLGSSGRHRCCILAATQQHLQSSLPIVMLR